LSEQKKQYRSWTAEQRIVIVLAAHPERCKWDAGRVAVRSSAMLRLVQAVESLTRELLGTSNCAVSTQTRLSE
jgi:hypothetical protein